MKKAFAVTALVLAFALTGCNIGKTATDAENTAENAIHAGTTINEQLDELKSEYEIKQFTAPDGAPLNVSDATNGNENWLTFDCAYISYVIPFYELGMENDNLISLNTTEQKSKYNDYAEQKSDLIKVKAGDILEYGLVVTHAETAFIIEENQGYVSSTIAELSGEITLKGTIYCFQDENDPMGIIQGDLFFYPCSENALTPTAYSAVVKPLSDINSDEATGVPNAERFFLGNISDLDESATNVLGESEFTDVEVTLKDIILACNENGSTGISSAIVVGLTKT